MNNVDKQYLDLLDDILKNGVEKNTRAGKVKSVFGRMMRFNLQEGLPMLTTKKMFHRGVIEELLWFLKGETNIKYLVEKNVHIWDGDAYRHYKNLVNKHNEIVNELNRGHFSEEFNYEHKEVKTMEEFISCVLDGKHDVFLKNSGVSKFTDVFNKDYFIDYNFGDLGDVYGKQWRSFGISKRDQIKSIIDTLKTNPDDRRMLCIAFNPDVLSDVALPPCHVMFQFYTRELSFEERVTIACKRGCTIIDETTSEDLDLLEVPKRSLSCSFTMRSNDFCAGNPYNIASYSMLTYMLCEVCNMSPGELIYYGGDIHVYTNHIDGAKEQLSRNGSDNIPQLKFARKIDNIDDFKYEDFIIEGYEPDPTIKYQLNVGD